MASAALLGYLLGSGLWLIAIALTLLYYTSLTILQHLSHLTFQYRQSHPPSITLRTIIHLIICLPGLLIYILILVGAYLK